jgi:chorismate synthase
VSPASRTYTLRDLTREEEYQAALALQKLTWGPEFSELIPVAMLKLAQRLGGIAAGAFSEDDVLIGIVFGVTGFVAGLPVHWSDLLAVHPEWRNRGIGEALKWYQRDSLLRRGVARVHWTFDPLESRNAHVNFVRLGAIANEYVRDFYGASDSPLHAGIGTDRLIVTWQLDSERVTAHCLRPSQDPVGSTDGAPLVNPVIRNDNSLRSSAPRLDVKAPAIRIAIPLDVQALKARDPSIAVEWRRHTRAAFESYLARGYHVTGYLRGSEFGSYVLETVD